MSRNPLGFVQRPSVNLALNKASQYVFAVLYLSFQKLFDKSIRWWKVNYLFDLFNLSRKREEEGRSKNSRS